jgi:hypothetical protein
MPKETGKIVKIKKARKYPRIKLRIDIIVVLIIIAIGAFIGYNILVSQTQVQTETPKRDPYEVLAEVIDNKNESVAADILYKVRGDLSIPDRVIGVKDFILFRIRFMRYEVPENITVNNETITVNKTYEEYFVNFYKADYLGALLENLGFQYYIQNFSDFLVNPEGISIISNNSYVRKYLGTEKIENSVFEEVEAKVEEFSYTVVRGENTLDVYVKIWREPKYDVPIKLEVVINGHKIELEVIGINLFNFAEAPQY